MMLNVVAWPAPLGPMTPTISQSPALSVTSLAAWTPPKRMEQPRTSSTDIAHPHFRLVGVLEAEPPAAQPTLQRQDLLAHAAGMACEGEQQEHRPDHDRGVLLRQELERGNVEAVAEQLLEEVGHEPEECGADDHPRPVPQTPDDGHDHEHQRQLKVEQVPHHERVVVGEE